jgi:hypothetical protein
LNLLHEGGIFEELLGLGMGHQLNDGLQIVLVELGVASLLLLVLGGFQVSLEVGVVGLDLQSRFVGGNGVVNTVQIEEGGSFPLVASGPGGFHSNIKS